MGLAEIYIIRMMVIAMMKTTMLDVIGMVGIVVVTMLILIFATNVNAWTRNTLVCSYTYLLLYNYI